VPNFHFQISTTATKVAIKKSELRNSLQNVPHRNPKLANTKFPNTEAPSYTKQQQYKQLFFSPFSRTTQESQYIKIIRHFNPHYHHYPPQYPDTKPILTLNTSQLNAF